MAERYISACTQDFSPLSVVRTTVRCRKKYVTLELVSAIEARRAKKAAAAEAKQDASAGPTCSMGSSSSSRGSSSSSYGTVTYGVARPNPRVAAKPGDDPFHNPLIMILDDVLTDNNRR